MLFIQRYALTCACPPSSARAGGQSRRVLAAGIAHNGGHFDGEDVSSSDYSRAVPDHCAL